MITVFLFQFVLPLVLVGWIAIAPPRNLSGFGIHVISRLRGQSQA